VRGTREPEGATKKVIMTTQTPSPDALIVVGVDGSKQSKLALSWAVPISATIRASIDAFTDWHFPSTSAGVT